MWSVFERMQRASTSFHLMQDIQPPHGLIFALFMMAAMCGSSVPWNQLGTDRTKALCLSKTREVLMSMYEYVVAFYVKSPEAKRCERAREPAPMLITDDLFVSLCVPGCDVGQGHESKP